MPLKISLKGGEKVQKKKVSLSLVKKKKKVSLVLGSKVWENRNEEEEEEAQLIGIESFDKEANEKAKIEQQKAKVLVIRPPQTRTSITELTNKSVENEDEKLAYGLNVSEGPSIIQRNGSTVQHKEGEEEDPTLDSYQKVPVDQFGAAFLRGLGWKGDTEQDSKEDSVKLAQRPEFLGLGAKAAPPATKRKRDVKYNPVVLKDPKTGKIVEEDR